MGWLSASRRASREQVLSGDVIYEANSLLHTQGEFFPASLTSTAIVVRLHVDSRQLSVVSSQVPVWRTFLAPAIVITSS